MQSTMPATAQAVFEHHLHAFGNNDLTDLLSDYSAQSEVWTPEGKFTGLDEIAAFFSQAFTLLPKGSTSLELKKMIVDDEKVYITWSAESPVVSIPFATDSFLIKDGIIVWQTTAFQVAQK